MLILIQSAAGLLNRAYLLARKAILVLTSS
jgi:hypothetical protein